MAAYARIGVASLGALVLMASIGTASPLARQRTVPRVENRAFAAIASLAGKDNFAAYCAVCHGSDAKGNGPAAPAMKAPVPDLTMIAARHGGRFDDAAVEYVIRATGKMSTPAHGVEEMPIWGYVFNPYDSPSSARASATLRIANLVKYLKSIQSPAGGSR